MYPGRNNGYSSWNSHASKSVRPVDWPEGNRMCRKEYLNEEEGKSRNGADLDIV